MISNESFRRRLYKRISHTMPPLENLLKKWLDLYLQFSETSGVGDGTVATIIKKLHIQILKYPNKKDVALHF